jgi:hypothetical protein
MTQPPKIDDGSDVLALVHQLGMPGLRPPATEDPAAVVPKPPTLKVRAGVQVEDGSDTLALVHQLGMIGFRQPAGETARDSVRPPTPAAGAKVDDGSDALALVDQLGMPGLRQSTGEAAAFHPAATAVVFAPAAEVLPATVAPQARVPKPIAAAPMTSPPVAPAAVGPGAKRSRWPEAAAVEQICNEFTAGRLAAEDFRRDLRDVCQGLGVNSGSADAKAMPGADQRAAKNLLDICRDRQRGFMSTESFKANLAVYCRRLAP